MELDRFQDTALILRDYHGSMHRSMLLEPPSDVVCIPLLESPDVKDEEDKQDTVTEKYQHHHTLPDIMTSSGGSSGCFFFRQYKPGSCRSDAR